MGLPVFHLTPHKKTGVSAHTMDVTHNGARGHDLLDVTLINEQLPCLANRVQRKFKTQKDP